MLLTKAELDALAIISDHFNDRFSRLDALMNGIKGSTLKSLKEKSLLQSRFAGLSFKFTVEAKKEMISQHTQERKTSF